MPIESQLDHLVLGARDLEQGIALVEDLLGVAVTPGGKHERYGTHNCVMRLNHESTASLYFEIIAIDPDAEPQHTPRWYSLDNEDVRAQLELSPRLLAWVVNTRSIEEMLLNLPASETGRVIPLQRGELRWKMLVPSDGTGPDPLMPWIIEWPAGSHPTDRMPPTDCTCVSIDAYHPAVRQYEKQLSELGASDHIRCHRVDSATIPCQLQATVRGLHGDVVLPGIVWNQVDQMVP